MAQELPTADAARRLVRASLSDGDGGGDGTAAACLALLERCRAAPDWDTLDTTVGEILGVVVGELLALPLKDGAAVGAVTAVREKVLEEHDDLHWWAMHAAMGALERLQQESVEQPKKRARGAGGRPTPDSISANVIALMYGLEVPKKGPDGAAPELELFFSAELGAMRTKRLAEAGSMSELKSRQRNKLNKTGVLQLYTCGCYQRHFEDLWIGVLRMQLPRPRLLALLETMHTSLIPNLVDPRILFDFLCDTYNEGGMPGILALHSLFVLMTQHGLEYPAFFDRLYGLFTPDVCYLRHREHFFELSAQFLTSVGLSAALVAAFIKRAARLALHAPTPAVAFLVPFIRQLFLRHPETMVLIHRNDGAGGTDVWAGRDPYDEDAVDPTKSNALQSSAWELCALAEHTNPTVASAAKQLSDEIKQGIGEMDKLRRFSTRSFARLFTREVLKEVKRTPTAAYSAPALFKAPRPKKGAEGGLCALAEVFKLE